MPYLDHTQGPDYDKARDIRKNHLNPVVSTVTYYKEPLMIHQVGCLCVSVYVH